MKQQSTALVIFGITGNLAQHKLLPAIYHLVKSNNIPDKFVIVGVFRRPPIIDELLLEMKVQLERDNCDIDEDAIRRLGEMIRPIQMDSTKPEDFERLKSLLNDLNAEFFTAFNHLFYLAIPPDIFRNVISCLNKSGLNSACEANDQVSRILVEKPFGSDLQSAKQLIEDMAHYFNEDQIYRIDHYLAKETAQNILAFRFNNPLIEGIWSREFIDHIQITAAETISIEGRSAFYEGMGALRDIVQSHLLQIMALVMMENPGTSNSEAIHKEKLELLKNIKPIPANHIEEMAVRGQYEAYREEVQNLLSNTETYAALKLEVSNFRWGGVPVLVRTGKCLTKKATEITVVFKDRTRRSVPANVLTIRIQPNEGISVQLLAKQPGFNDELKPVHMEFGYTSSFRSDQPDAYQRVLVDAIRGDQSLFASSEEVLACWELLQPIIDAWSSSKDQPEVYSAGSWGPSVAAKLAESYGSEWVEIAK